MTADVSHAYAAPRWAVVTHAWTDRITTGAPGPKILKFAWVINVQKVGTFAFLGLLMWLYAPHTPAATSAAAWIYLALHGSYGLVWFLKDRVLPDPNWEQPMSVLGGIDAFLFVLGPYWLFGWLLISGTATRNYPLPDGPWFMLCISLVVLGCVVMIAADAQKFFTLRVQRGLITDGMFRYVRHPNYTGEMMIYGGFALLVWHWLPVIVLAWVWLALFAVNMNLKEASMSRYPDWAAYKKRTKWVIPFVL